jgi:hypothetical protein
MTKILHIIASLNAIMQSVAYSNCYAQCRYDEYRSVNIVFAICVGVIL